MTYDKKYSGKNSRRPKAFMRQASDERSRDVDITEELNDNENLKSGDRLEGKNAVNEALKSGREINKIFILKTADNQKLERGLYLILKEAEERKIVVSRVPRATLDRMSNTHNHQGVIASVASHQYVELDDIINNARDKGHQPLIVVLDQLKDSYNLGSVLRIADAAGVDGVVIPKHRSIGLDSVVAKASAGAIEYVPVARVDNLSRTLMDLKDDGFWIMGTDIDADTLYDKADYSGALAIVIGSEGEGMRNSIKKCCDYLISIPMVGHVNSLNAAVASGIIIFEAMKNRGKS